MENLVNLLNEYDKSENINAYRWEIEGGDIIGYNRFRGGYETINVSESVIISKWYEFIKRLVDNNKIDYHNKINYDISLAINRVTKKTTREERLLMMLAIQENPIKYLCNILK